MTSHYLEQIWDPSREEFAGLFEAWKRGSLNTFEQWSSALKVLHSRHGDSFNDNEKTGCAALLTLKELACLSIGLTKTTLSNDSMWEMPSSTFKKVVPLAEQVTLPDEIEFEIRPATGVTNFCIDGVVTVPLFDVLCRCRQISLRKKAAWVI